MTKPNEQPPLDETRVIPPLPAQDAQEQEIPAQDAQAQNAQEQTELEVTVPEESAPEQTVSEQTMSEQAMPEESAPSEQPDEETPDVILPESEDLPAAELVKEEDVLRPAPHQVAPELLGEPEQAPFPWLRVLAIGLAVFLIAGVATAIYFVSRGRANETPVTQTMPATIRPSIGEVFETEDFESQVLSSQTDSPKSAVSATVTEVKVAQGATVKAGDVICELDASAIEEKLAIQQEKLQLLQRSASQTTTTTKTTNATQDVISTATGTLKHYYVSNSEKVTRGTKLADIATVSGYELKVPFNLELASTLAVGSSVNVIMAQSGQTVIGTVSAIGIASLNEEGASVSDVTITIPAEGALTDGESASAMFGGVYAESVSTIHAQDESITSVFAASDGQVSARLVATDGAVKEGQVFMTLSVTETEQVSVPAATSPTMSLDIREVELEIAQLEKELKDYTFVAPYDGTIEAINVKVKDRVTPQAPIYTIARSGSLYIPLTLSEEIVKELSIGQSVNIVVPEAAPEGEDALRFAGTITEIAEEAVEDEKGVEGYSVKIGFEPQPTLKEEMAATVTMITYVNQEALLVPSELVQNELVQVWQDETRLAVKVRVGVERDGYTEIKSGLTQHSLLVDITKDMIETTTEQ